MEKWKIESEKKVHENKIFTIRELDCTHEKKKVRNDFFVMDTFDWINVIALTIEGKFILVKQHRLGTDEISIETPGGMIDEGENPVDCAVRELREETGYIGESVHLLKSLWVNPAIMSNRIIFYLVEGCKPSASHDLDEAEDIDVVTVSADELAAMISDGRFSHSVALTGIGLYFLSSHNRFGSITF